MATTLEVMNAAQLALLNNSPTATMYQTSVQSIPNAVNTQITWNTASGDNWGGWSSGSNTRYTVQLPGWYMLDATVQWSGNSAGGRHVEFYYNGAEQINSLTILNPANASPFPHSANTVQLYANAGDYFQVNVYQGAGAAINTATVSAWSVEWLHF